MDVHPGIPEESWEMSEPPSSFTSGEQPLGKLQLAAFAMVAGVSYAATPTHLYELNDNFLDTFGGPALVSNGGSLVGGNYVFGTNQGLTLDGALNTGAYTIDTSFTFSETSGYRKIVDFRNLAADTGLYNLSNALNFYNITTGPADAFSPGQQVHLTITRDATGTFSGYINGVLQLTFDDSVVDLATFNTANNRAIFFADDAATGNREASAGSVDYVAIYDHALTVPEVASLAAPVPEPETYALMLAGLVAVGAMARRRKQG